MHSSSEVGVFIIAVIDIHTEMMNRRQLRDTIVDKSADLMTSIFGNRSRAALAVTALHALGAAVVAFLVFISSQLHLVLVGVAIWIVVAAAHIFFDGCLLIRIERKLLQDPTWLGFASLLFEPLQSLGVDVTVARRKRIFDFLGLAVTLAVVIRTARMCL